MVLAAVTPSEPAAARSRWQRFKDWLRGLLTTHPQADDPWLRRWLADLKLPSSATELIGWAALTVVVALAAGIIGNELRIAGVLRRRADHGRPHPDAAGSAASPALADLERAAPEEQPRLLLELIACRLATRQPLAPTRALTGRELERQARLPGEAARAWLAELVGVCERVRFSAESVSASNISAAVHGGRLLLLSLEQAPLSVPAQEA
jgi:hypothetical protein